MLTWDSGIALKLFTIRQPCVKCYIPVVNSADHENRFAACYIAIEMGALLVTEPTAIRKRDLGAAGLAKQVHGISSTKGHDEVRGAFT